MQTRVGLILGATKTSPSAFGGVMEDFEMLDRKPWRAGAVLQQCDTPVWCPRGAFSSARLRFQLPLFVGLWRFSRLIRVSELLIINGLLHTVPR